jgi:uncharacterized protein (DUF2235 family)
MTKLLVCFDGTGNEPEDAIQETDKSGKLEDDNISNVLKLHLLAGGTLDNKESLVAGQHSLYFSGVGTRGSFLRRVIRKAFAARAPKVIINEALEALEERYTPTDRLYIFGFSRGAAIARLFASQLAKDGLQTRDGTHDPAPVVTMLGAWDTVAAFGKPNLKSRQRPRSDVFFENGTIAPIIRNAYHLVSVDENRLAFRPTLMNAQPEVNEVWFPGVHSDVGGGYRLDGLSDVTLKFMIERAKENGLGFLKVAELGTKSLHGVDPDDDPVTIDKDDIALKPDHTGLIHAHDEVWRNNFTLAPRDVVITRSDVASEQLPLIHHSVLDRIRDAIGYRPHNLDDDAYRVLGSKGEVIVASLA